MFSKFGSLALLAVVLFGSASVQARSPMRPPVEGAALRILSLDAGLQYAADQASVRVDYAANEVTLTVTESFSCASGAVCATVMPPVHVYKAPIINRSLSCGSTIVVARLDQRPVDGSLTEITVEDHRGRMCRDLHRGTTEVSLVTAHYERRRGGGETRTESTFAGDELAAIAMSLAPRTDLTFFDVDAKLFGGAPMLGGYVLVNNVSNDVLLSLTYAPCSGAGMTCEAVSATCEFELKIISRSEAGCGSKRILAEMVQSGYSEKLELIDHSERMCTDLIPHTTVLTFETTQIDRRFITQTRSTFGGGLLQ
jgi:hypothetical protein